MRKLATIRKIRNLIPITGADRIEMAQLDDWFCIVKKGEFQIGDKGVYFEIDSFLPKDVKYAFLESYKKTQQGIEGYRIKTIKMKGVLSQGLVLPLSLFPELAGDEYDVTTQLNVVKYDTSFASTNTSTIISSGKPTGNFPAFIQKTEQERIQNLPIYYELYKNELFEETLKLDGSSCTMYTIGRNLTFFDKLKKFFGFSVSLFHFGVCSRNLEIKEASGVESPFWDIAYKYNIKDRLPVGFAIQGELIGPKIQGNHEKVMENKFFIFDVWDINKQQYLTPEERKCFIKEYLDYELHIPIVTDAVPIFSQCTTIADLIKRVEGASFNPNTVSEGRVYKMVRNPSITFKVINPEYLLKHEN